MAAPYLALGWASAPTIYVYRRDTATTLTTVATIYPSGVPYGLSWSPNCKYLAVSMRNNAGNGANIEIYKMSGAVGSETFTLLSAPTTAYVPSCHTAWSSDSTRLINSGYTSAGGFNSPVLQFYNVASDVFTFDRQVTGYARAQGRIKISSDNKYIYGAGVGATGLAEVFVQAANGLDYTRTNFYSVIGSTSNSGVGLSGSNFALGGTYANQFRMFNNNNGTFTEFTYASGRPAYGGYVPILPDGTYMVRAEDNSSTTVADQLKMYSISGTTLTAATGPNLQMATGITTDGVILANDAEWSPDGATLVVALNTSAASSPSYPFMVWYNRSGGSLTKQGQPSDTPAGSAYSVAWGAVPPPTITISATTNNSSGYFLQGAALANSTGYFLQGPVLDNAVAIFQTGDAANLASTLANASANFIEGNDGNWRSTLDGVTSNFIEGNDGNWRSTLGSVSAFFQVHQRVYYANAVAENVKGTDTGTGLLGPGLNPVAESVVLNDTVIGAFLMRIVEAVTMNASPSLTYVAVNKVLEQIVVQGLAPTTVAAANLVVEAMKLTDVATRGFTGLVTENVTLQDLPSERITAILNVLDAVVMQSSISNSAIVIQALSSSIVVDENVTLSALLKQLLTEGISFKALFAGSNLFDTWVVNTESSGPSRYTNFNFNSFASRNGYAVGASGDGLYFLEGEDDAGVAVDASITTGITDFDTPNLKRVEYVYLGFTADGTLALKVQASENGKLVERLYTIEGQRKGDLTEGRMRLARGVNSRYWQFVLTNVNGADFDVDSVNFDIIRMSRRLYSGGSR